MCENSPFSAGEANNVDNLISFIENIGSVTPGTLPPFNAKTLREGRAVVLRRPLLCEMVVAQQDKGLQLLGFIQANRKATKRITGYEYAALVTNLEHEMFSLGHFYRVWADAEKIFDKLKNQWGWAASPRTN